MPWAKLDDSFWGNPKVDAASLGAVGAYARSLSYVAQHLTDGHIPYGAALYMTKGEADVLAELVDRGFWAKNGDGFVIPDYLEYNPTKAEVESQRRARSEAGKRGGLASGKARGEANG